METIKTLPETICKDCSNKFRYNPGNSTIKPTRCRQCENKLKFAKQRESSQNRIKQNQKLLRKSSFGSNSYKSKTDSSRYAVKSKSGKKRLKSPRDRFYQSTAWKWFSRYVLLYYSIDGDICKCSTCGTFKRVNDSQLHCGHWIKVFDGNSSNYATSFEFTNVGPQCGKCNTFMGGREILMMEFLEEQHGREELDRLRVLSKQIFKLDDYTLQQIAEEYREKFNQLLKERGWKNPWKK